MCRSGLWTCMLALPLLATSQLGYAGGTGQVRYADHDWQVADALAYPCDDTGICVAVSAARFDREKFSQDGVIDSVDMHEGQAADARYLVLSFDADGILRDVGAYGPDGAVNQSDDSMLSAFSLQQADDQRIAGTLNYSAEGDSIVLSFDVAIVSGVDH